MPPGSMIFNIEGGVCRLGVVNVGDAEYEDEIGRENSFRHFGGVSYEVQQIQEGCVAWLDGNMTHYGAVHDGACVRLHVEFKNRMGLVDVLAEKQNEVVQITSVSELVGVEKQSTTKKLVALGDEERAAALAPANSTKRVSGQEGFVVRYSESGMASVHGLKEYADEFGRSSAKDSEKGFPRKDKGEGIILFKDVISQRLEKAGDVDHRPFRVLYKLVAPEGEGKREIEDTYPALPRESALATRKLYMLMVGDIEARAYKEMEGLFGVGTKEAMRVTKIILIAYGTREQLVHRDMTAVSEADLVEGCVPHGGNMIFNIQGGTCRLGVVNVGDARDKVSSIGKEGGFRHYGGVSYEVRRLRRGRFAWLDGSMLHYGAVHDGACVRLHVEFRKRLGLEDILLSMNRDVRVVNVLELAAMEKESTTRQLEEKESEIEAMELEDLGGSGSVRSGN